MALNETQKHNLSKLYIIDGTGVFTDNKKVDSIDQPTIIVGLGGLGCKTLNALKQQIKRNVSKENNFIRLLAIDSDETSIEQLLSYGNLEKYETLSLYDPTIHTMFTKKATIPEYILKWLNEDFTPRQFEYRGIGVRQIGRLVLSIPAVYSKVRNKIKETILEYVNVSRCGNINIIFVTGISGATGGGTLVDLAYLTRDVMLELGRTPESYKMLSYLYMPSVQFKNGASTEALRMNGYATLKELDYHMNLDKNNGVYRWPFIEGEIKNTNKNVFDFCTLISTDCKNEKDSIKNETTIITNVVESMITFIADTRVYHNNGNYENIISALFDQPEHIIEDWKKTGNGVNSAIYPQGVNYKYNILNYNSAKIPVDAIMSYLALKMYEPVLEEYKDIKELDVDYISRLMISGGAGDMDTIINAVKEHSQCSFNPAVLPSGGDIHGAKYSYKFWRDHAIEHYSTYKNTQPFFKAIDNVTADIIRAFDSKLNMAFGQQGPYFVSKAITASLAADGVDGVLRKIDSLIRTMGNEYDDRREECNTTDRLIAALDQKAADVPAILGIVKQEDRDSYLYMAKSTIEKFTVEMEILARMQEKLVEVRNFLVDSNNKVFEVYTNVLDYIKEILAKNSKLALKNEFNIVDLEKAQLRDCLDSILTPEFLAKFKNEFETLLREPKNRPAFTDTTDKFNASMTIQRLFDYMLGLLYLKDAVEILLVGYYYPYYPYLDDVDQIFRILNNESQRRQMLTIAIQDICMQLKNSIKPLCGVSNIDINSFAVPQQYICCPSELYDIFESVVPFYFPNAKVCPVKNSFSIDLVTNHIGIPLCYIDDMEEMDTAYNNAIQNRLRGLHIDESEKFGFASLPSPYIWNTEDIDNV